MAVQDWYMDENKLDKMKVSMVGWGGGARGRRG